MSYKREGDEITLTMSEDDYDTLLIFAGYALASARVKGRYDLWAGWVRTLNSINAGNPAYTPMKRAKRRST